MDDDDRFVFTAGELKEKYGYTAENRPYFKLDPHKVPPALRHLIPLAEKFGISDDVIRDDVVAKAPPDEVEAMKKAVLELDNGPDSEFDNWRAGSEADGLTFSLEYIAFSALRLAAL